MAHHPCAPRPQAPTSRKDTPALRAPVSFFRFYPYKTHETTHTAFGVVPLRYFCPVTVTRTIYPNHQKQNIMLNYKLSARQNPSDREAASKVYASVVSSGHLTMEMICANIERNSTATRGDVKGVALAFANGIAKSLANGNSVYLEDLGFSVSA